MNTKVKNSYERYKEEICPECTNKTTDLCDIRRKIDGTLKCGSFERCLINKCKNCKNKKECFKDEEKKV